MMKKSSLRQFYERKLSEVLPSPSSLSLHDGRHLAKLLVSRPAR
jgi:hypothetical protein